VCECFVGDSAYMQIEQCKLKCSLQDLIRLLIVANPSLENESVVTAREQSLMHTVEELESSNKSLRQNLLDTINDLKSTEKENENIFAEKLKLLKQLGKPYEETMYSQNKSMLSKDDHLENLQETLEEHEESGDFDDYRNPLDKIDEGDALLKENSELIDKSQNLVNKYNSVIKSELGNTSQQEMKDVQQPAPWQNNRYLQANEESKG